MGAKLSPYEVLEKENRELRRENEKLKKECVETARLFTAEENKVAILQQTLNALIKK